MEKFVLFFVQWIVLPIIMFVLFLFSIAIVSSTRGEEQRISAHAGFWAGLVIFVIYVTSQVTALQTPRFAPYELEGLWIPQAAIGVLIGFIFMLILKIFLPTRLVGFITLSLSATSTSALFSYVFISYLRPIVLYWILGLALGILLYIILFPDTIQAIFSEKSSQKSPGG